MKKLTSLIMAIILVATLFILTGCNDTGAETPETNNDDTVVIGDFVSHVDSESSIIGKWVEISGNSNADKYTWLFMKSTTLHMTETYDDVSTSTVCAYNFNEETGELSYYVYNESQEYNVLITFKGDRMVVSSTEGEALYTFEKVK